MPGPWNDSTDRKLLLTMMHLTMPKLPDWDAVAELMGDAFTASACRQHFQKLRKETTDKFGEPGDALEGTPAKGTPRKKSTATPSKGKSKVNGRRKGRNEDTDDDEEETPAKKTSKVEDGDLV